MSRPIWILALLAGCTVPHEVELTLAKSEQTIAMARQVYAPLCAPEELANAESHLSFTKLELKQGHMRRAGEHVDVSYENAVKALEISTPCGAKDTDQDTIPDIIDRCPQEKEDLDGDRDHDGCRDIDPNGDEDGDGIVNIDDGCIDDPEDIDGHNDEDGCPETSEDSDGDGLIDAVDTCPNDPEDLDGFKDTDGCPDTDNDEDGVADINDACAMVAEDPDGWEDDDGCPDADNDADTIPDTLDECPNEPGDRSLGGCPTQDADGDGIADANDKCPTEPETVNQYLDDDGCPDSKPTRVKVTRERVEITDTIQFETGKATLKSASFPILDDVYQVLQDSPDMQIRIEGHTDSQGSDSFNLKLSQSRAESVRTYLIEKGVTATRLEAVGFGETKPIDTNRTDVGRAKNRRVEFHIVNM